MKTVAQVKAEFLENGISIRAWSRANGYSERSVYELLSGRKRGLRGKTHEIAVRLKLKAGRVGANIRTVL